MDMQQQAYRATFMRTGTSKSVYFKKNELPEDPVLRDKVLLAVMGSPDPVQIDGMGGAVVSTSKIAIISPSDREDADVDYTYGQVSLTEARVDYSGNCGNCSSGVGPYAIDEGMVPVTEPITRVRVYNTNTNAVLIEDVRVVGGKAAVDGDCKIDGIPGTGSRIDINMRSSAGASTGKLFPTGNRRDVVHVTGLGEVPVTIMDLGNPIVYVHAKYVGATGIENRLQITANQGLLDRLELVREQGAILIGACKPGESAVKVTPNRPQVVFFNGPMDCVDYVTGKLIPASEVNFVARNIFIQKPIDSYTAIGGVNTALCSIIKGTVLYEAAVRREPDSDLIHFGNPRGISEAEARVADDGENIVVEKASMPRTARRIMDGYVYVRKSQLI